MENTNNPPEDKPTSPVTPETSPPERRRGPGRPRKGGSTDTAAPVPPTASEPPKKRGRPKGSGSKVQAIDSDALAKQLAGVHMMVAQITGIPEFQIHETEAAMLASSVAAVCDEYDLNLNGKTGAFLQLIASAAFIYFPRIPHIQARIVAKRQGGENERETGSAH